MKRDKNKTHLQSDALGQRLKALEARLATLEDGEKIKKLMRAYGYYLDKQLWDQTVDLFSDNCSIEVSGRGVYLGKKGANTFFRSVLGGGKTGLTSGMLFNHLILQGIVDVDPNGVTALGRWRAFLQIGKYGDNAAWGEGVYENEYLKDEGVWKIAKLHWYSTFVTPYEDGWAKTGLPLFGPSTEYPPDLPQSVQYEIFPGNFVPPFHYKNPVTGR